MINLRTFLATKFELKNRNKMLAALLPSLLLPSLLLPSLLLPSLLLPSLPPGTIAAAAANATWLNASADSDIHSYSEKIHLCLEGKEVKLDCEDFWLVVAGIRAVGRGLGERKKTVSHCFFRNTYYTGIRISPSHRPRGSDRLLGKSAAKRLI